MRRQNMAKRGVEGGDSSGAMRQRRSFETDDDRSTTKKAGWEEYMIIEAADEMSITTRPIMALKEETPAVP